MEYLKFFLFTTIMIYAGIIDYKKNIVPKHVYILLFLNGLINVDISSLTGMLFIFIPLFIIGITIGGLGGGDVKISALCGFTLKGIYSLIGVGMGLAFGIVLPTLFRLIKHKKNNEGVALVPYFAMGTILTYIIILI